MSLRFFGKNGMAHTVLIYSGANTAVKLTPMILLPILTRRFTPEEYGIMTSFLACLSIVEMAVLMGGVDAVVRAYFEREDNPNRFGRFVFNTCLINAVVGVLTAVFFICFSSRLQDTFHIPGPLIFLIPLLGFLLALFSYPQKLAVFERKPVRYSLFSGLYMVADLGSTLFFVFCFSWSWQGRVAGILFTRLLAGFGSLWYLKSRGFWRPAFDIKVMRESVAYGFPVFVHSMGFIFLTSMDRLFLSAYVGVAATGIYGVATALVGVTNIVIAAFGLTWTPMLFERLKAAREGNKAYLMLTTYKIAAVMAVGMAVFALLVPFVLRLVAGEKYQSAVIHLHWLCAAAFFNGLYVAVSGYIFYYKKVNLLAIVSVSMVGIGAVLYTTLIKMNGPIGAAQANCAVFFIRFLAMVILGNLVCPMPWLSIFRRHRSL